jgi:hypothetical protein
MSSPTFDLTMASTIQSLPSASSAIIVEQAGNGRTIAAIVIPAVFVLFAIPGAMVACRLLKDRRREKADAAQAIGMCALIHITMGDNFLTTTVLDAIERGEGHSPADQGAELSAVGKSMSPKQIYDTH